MHRDDERQGAGHRGSADADQAAICRDEDVAGTPASDELAPAEGTGTDETSDRRSDDETEIVLVPDERALRAAEAAPGQAPLASCRWRFDALATAAGTLTGGEGLDDAIDDLDRSGEMESCAATASGVMLIDPDRLAREIGSDGLLGDPDEGAAATSPEDQQRRAFLRRHADAPGGLFRRHLVADAGTMARLDAAERDAQIRRARPCPRGESVTRGCPARVPQGADRKRSERRRR